MKRITSIGLAVVLLSACTPEDDRVEAPAAATPFGTFRIEGSVVDVPGEDCAPDALAPGRGFVRGAPLSNALLKPGQQEPKTLVKTFSTSLRRPGPDGERTLYRVMFRSSKHEEFRQELFGRGVVDAAGARLLDYVVKVDGAYTTNGREYWLTFEPNGLGEGDFSVFPHGTLDLESRRLDVTLLERLPGQAARRYRLAFAIDDAFHFTRLGE